MDGKYQVALDIPQRIIAKMHEYFTYEPDTGRLLWSKSYSQVHAGTEVGSLRKDCGYRYLRSNVVTDGKSVAVHRAIWMMHHGVTDPHMCVDHIDGNKTNNRLSNLRLVTPGVNTQNTHNARKNSTSGIPGVYWHARTKRWMSRVAYTDASGAYRSEYLGYFTDPDSAYRAYVEAKRRLHPGNTL